MYSSIKLLFIVFALNSLTIWTIVSSVMKCDDKYNNESDISNQCFEIKNYGLDSTQKQFCCLRILRACNHHKLVIEMKF